MSPWIRPLEPAATPKKTHIDGSKAEPRVGCRAAWKEAQQTQTIYGSRGGSWEPASSEVAAGACGVTYGNNLGGGGEKLASGDVAGRGVQLTQEEASLTGRQNSTRSPGVQEGRKRLAFQQLLGQTAQKGTVQKSMHFEF